MCWPWADYSKQVSRIGHQNSRQKTLDPVNFWGKVEAGMTRTEFVTAAFFRT